MSQRSNPTPAQPGPEQQPLFGARVDRATRMVLGEAPQWQYPCGLCNGPMVLEPGGLCATCAPTPPRSRRKTAAKKTGSRKPRAAGREVT